MKQKILDLLSENYSKNHGGMNLIQLGEKLKIPQVELKSELNALHKEKQILIRKGINHILIYKK